LPQGDELAIPDSGTQRDPQSAGADSISARLTRQTPTNERPYINNCHSWADTFAVRFSDASLVSIFAEFGANLLIFAPSDFSESGLETSIANLPPGTWLEFPPWLMEDSLEMARRIIHEHKRTLGGVVLGSIGQLGMDFHKGSHLPIAFGAGIPLTNTAALHSLAQYNPAFWTLWPELSLNELMDMQPQGTRPLLAVFGRERLMLLSHCPERMARGLHRNRAECELCRNSRMACGCGDAMLIDRKGFRFPFQRVRMPEGCVVQVLNALPTDLRQQEEARKALGAGMLLSFTVEPPQEQLRLVKEFAEVRKGMAGVWGREGQTTQTTQGHFFRGVE